MWRAMTDIDDNSNIHGTIPRFALAMNFLPLIHLVTGGVAVIAIDGAVDRCLTVAAWLYLLPPLCARLVMAVWGRPQGRGLERDSRDFKVWWVLAQLQMVFNRLPILEEVLRLVPGVYALWLNLWGSRVSPFAFWGPGARVIDRGLVQVGHGAIIGAQAALTGHLGRIATDGSQRVDVAIATVGPGAMIGARSGLGPGCTVAAGEELPAMRLLPPFTHWQGGRKIRQ